MKPGSKISKIPNLPGVYLFKSSSGKIIYVGKAINLPQRIKYYLQPAENLDLKTTRIVQEAASLDFIPVESEFEALLLEARLIKEEKPKFNTKWKDDKSFLYILMTREKFPRVLAARKSQATSGEYFGPFPKAETVRQVLKLLRRIFPYCSQKLSKRACFYSHLSLCNPCPSNIVKLGKDEGEKLRQEYLGNIACLRRVLSGKGKKVIKGLESEMRMAAKKEEFEKATRLREQIRKLTFMTSPRARVTSYLENPSFLEDERKIEIESLEEFLSPFFGKLALSRIECFDVSNLFGQKATGSMVVFIHGIEEKGQYRRFRIEKKGKPNDVAMIKEIIKRRFSHPEWELPDLVLIDGGKGQVDAVLTALGSLKLEIPVIGLAKRLERLVIGKKANFKIIRLPASSPILNLLKRARDEAHRFAIAYHKKLRRNL